MWLSGKFYFFFRNLTNLNSILTALGENFIKVVDYCQKIGILEYPVCFKNVLFFIYKTGRSCKMVSIIINATPVCENAVFVVFVLLFSVVIIFLVISFHLQLCNYH